MIILIVINQKLTEVFIFIAATDLSLKETKNENLKIKSEVAGMFPKAPCQTAPIKDKKYH